MYTIFLIAVKRSSLPKGWVNLLWNFYICSASETVFIILSTINFLLTFGLNQHKDINHKHNGQLCWVSHFYCYAECCELQSGKMSNIKAYQGLSFCSFLIKIKLKMVKRIFFNNSYFNQNWFNHHLHWCTHLFMRHLNEQINSTTAKETGLFSTKQIWLMATEAVQNDSDRERER